jgi:spermidine dehydrogenase
VRLPGGNSYLARRVLKRLVPDSIDGSTRDDVINNPIRYGQIDLTTNPVRYRINATGLRVDQDTTSAWVTYYFNGKFYRAKAKAVVLAGQMHTARQMVGHLIDSQRLTEMKAYQTVPSLVMNVAMRHSRHLVEIGPSYDYYWYSSGIWQDALRADYMAIKDDPAKLNDGTRRTVMTVYDGFFGDPAIEGPQQRAKLLVTPFSVYEDALRQDLNRAFGRYGFDFNRDVESLSLYRWGHALCVPYVGWTFGPPKTGHTGIERIEGNRQKGRKQIGRISFGAQDTEGAPATEDAIYAGVRTAHETDRHL